MAKSFVSVRVSGLTRVTRSLIEMGVEVDDLKDAFASIAKQGAAIAEAHAPVLTGTLRGDIRGNRAKNKAVVSAGRVSVPYAGPINYGWPSRHIEASGFMQSVDTILGPKVPAILERSINELITRYGLG